MAQEKFVTMKTILIFEPLTGGHRAGFIRWLADAIKENPPAGRRFIFFTAAEAEKIRPGLAGKLSTAGRWKKQVLLYQLFRQACREYKPDHALILELTRLELALSLYGAPCPVSAILFVQYPELPRGVKFFFKHWKTRLLLRRAPVKNLFLLNGEKSCSWLSTRFGARARFIPVPDPVAGAAADPAFVMRDAYRISSERRVFLFFGAVSPRKGADVLIKALHLLSPDTAAKSAFVFCGRPEADYAARFRQSCSNLRKIRPDIQLNIDDNFVSDECMAALFEQSDVVLMPYTRPEYSSGILALAAKARIPVIGPDTGLLGRLIRQNGLGAVCAVCPEAVAKSIADAALRPPVVDEALRSVFVQKSRPEEFARIILNALGEDL
jgi:glycosyltransferase involved in cell wall biosynthesis